jgi:long-chain acyl-CoA synthetase
MSRLDPDFAALTAPGSAFAIAEQGQFRQFVNAPTDLATMIDGARRFGDATFLLDEADDGGQRQLSYAQVFAWRDRLVPLLGIARGDRVAICMRNRAEWVVAFLAVIKAGGVATLMNSRGAPSELVAMIDEVTPALALVDGERAALLRDGGFTGRMLNLTAPLDAHELAQPLENTAIALALAAPDEACTILFTSGTTGRVKGAVLSHRNLITGLMSVQLSGMQVLHNMARTMNTDIDTLLQNLPQQATVLVYPLFHISGLGSGFLSPMLSGSKVVIMRRWEPQAALDLIIKERVTAFNGVPTMLWDILNCAKLGDADLSGLRNIASGGQALPVNLVQELRNVCPQAMMGTGYGMTECSGAIAQAVGEDFTRKPDSAGRVLPLVDVHILGPDGEVLPAGQAGEIAVRGAQVMKRYWNRPEETATVLSADGWLRTGDVGIVDEEGYVFIVDRKKDMVISGGENIYCAEVERALGEMPAVTECATFGIPHERLGELLVAVVRTTELTDADVIAWVGERLARYKAPGHVAIVTDPLARNHLGKIDKIALRAAWTRLHGDD